MNALSSSIKHLRDAFGCAVRRRALRDGQPAEVADAVGFHGVEPLEPRLLLSGAVVFPLTADGAMAAGPQIANDDNDSGWSVTQQILAGEPIGQTFQAISDNGLDAISMYLTDMNASTAPDAYSVTFELYEGIGTGGRLLGEREYTKLSDGFSGYVEVDFSAVTLADGEMYTIAVTNDTARWGRQAVGNQYAGGTALYAGAPSPTAGALFRVHWQPDLATVFARKVFYNNSIWDRFDPLPGSTDDRAIATDKHALLPGEPATSANYTGYSHGINGIMIDIEDLADPDGLSVATVGDYFGFKVGTSVDPSHWGTAPRPQHVDVRLGDGDGGIPTRCRSNPRLGASNRSPRA